MLGSRVVENVEVSHSAGPDAMIRPQYLAIVEANQRVFRLERRGRTINTNVVKKQIGLPYMLGDAVSGFGDS